MPVYLGTLKPQTALPAELLARIEAVPLTERYRGHAIRVAPEERSEPDAAADGAAVRAPRAAGEGVAEVSPEDYARRGRKRDVRRAAQVRCAAQAVEALRVQSGLPPRRGSLAQRILAAFLDRPGAVLTSAEVATAIDEHQKRVQRSLASACRQTQGRGPRLQARVLRGKSGRYGQYRLPCDAEWPELPEGTRLDVDQP